MLQLQLRSLLPKLPKKNIFFAKLLLFSFLIHCIFFIVLLMTQSYFSRELIRLSEISDGSMVILMPLIKTISSEVKQPTSIKKTVTPKKEMVVGKKRIPLPAKNKVQKKSVQSPLPSKKTILPKVQEKPLPKKLIPEKKQSIKKSEKAKEVVVKKDEIKKIVPVPEAIKEVIIPEPKANSSSAIQEVGRYDLELIALCNEIKEGIAQAWKRPANISSLLECRVKVCVHSDRDREVTITQSSQALALDIMVKNFVLEYPFPKAIWHKEIELIF